PAASVAVAVMLYVPLLKVLVMVLVQLPLPSAVAVPRRVLPVKSLTVLSASAVPLKVGVVLLVRLSVLELPVSLAAVRSGVVGALGAPVSMVPPRALEALLLFPATSAAVAVMLCRPPLKLLLVLVQLPLPSAATMPTGLPS